jgi:hypothetical protein
MKPRARSSREARRGRRRWYLLIHQLPPKPLYLRAKIRQRLLGVGAIALKKSVYVLPLLDQCLEDFEWIAEEAIAGGGEAYVCAAEFLDVSTDDALLARFTKERNADYESIEESLRPAGNRPAPLAQARKRLEEIAKIDFFEAPFRARVERQLRRVEAADRRRSGYAADQARAHLSRKTWVTRRGIHIDRIASAWLIRRFIDPQARFRFVDPPERAKPGEVSFDMVGGDFTHEGDRCTFETLLARAGVADRTLTEIAEIVHDIDLKDGKFGRPEAVGLEQVLIGLVLANPEDRARLERGFVLFDELRQSFRKHIREASKETRE